MKRILCFSLFSCGLLLFIPLAPSVELNLVRDSIEEEFNYDLEETVFNLGIFDNINIFKFLIKIVKIMIFFELGFSFYFIIVCIKEQYGIVTGNLFKLLYGFLWNGFMVFINCFYELIYQLLSLNIDLIIFYLSIFLIGFFIWYLVEIKPNISNYLKGSFIYGLFIYLHIYYISQYFDFEP